jgi:hypothetical protein
VNRAINLSIRPMRDIDQYGIEDLSSSPLATLAAGAGDCEDYAIAKYVALREAGAAEDDLRLAIVHDATVDEEHAEAIARLDGHCLVLAQLPDNRWLALVESKGWPGICRCSRWVATGCTRWQWRSRSRLPSRAGGLAPGSDPIYCRRACASTLGRLAAWTATHPALRVNIPERRPFPRRSVAQPG